MPTSREAKRNHLLDKHGDPDSEIVTFDGVDYEVRALPISDVSDVTGAAGTIDNVELVIRCTYDPDNGERVFEAADREQLHQAPSHAGGWFQQLANAARRVQGWAAEMGRVDALQTIVERANALARADELDEGGVIREQFPEQADALSESIAGLARLAEKALPEEGEGNG